MTIETSQPVSFVPDPLEHLESLDMMDDFLSLGSPTLSSTSHPKDAIDSPTTWRLSSNAVHMEVQENAKIPTFNHPVDRTNSDTNRLFDFIVDENHLAEYFLKDEKRQSMQAAYASVGALNTENVKTILQHGPSDPLDELAAEVDPTPLDEIRRRHDDYEQHQQQQHNYYPYGRPYQLPLPTKKISPPASPQNASETAPLADAIATAAAIVQQTDKRQDNKLPQRPTHTPPSHSAAHAVTRGAIEHASQQKSQYGFGSNHVVPSVPQPPEKKKTASDPSRGKAPTPINSVANAGAAYERKKQRAKDARVKLNESIEQLATAINLAGTQSAQRQAQWDSIMADSTGLGIIKESISIAEDAKKWDRPSFVGSAACLIQSLNAQCEALMRALQLVRSEPESSSNKRSAPPDEISVKRPRIEETPPSVISDGAPSSPRSDMVAEDGTVFAQPKILHRIARFLDPISLARTNLVSKSWQETGTFSDEDLWQRLVSDRFGYYNVRQWKERLDDEDEGLSTDSMTLYRSMDHSNVMPHFNHEGMLFLGESRLPGKISAWVFLVERSNGETLRSVLKEPASGSSGQYSSLPVVELRTIVQNTGISDSAVILREQAQSVDASTRRRGEEMKEIDWDDRFRKVLLNLDGSVHSQPPPSNIHGRKELCRLQLFDAVVLRTFIHARGCSTSSKFIQRANFTRVLVGLPSGVTVPLVIPFPRDAAYLQH